MQRHLPALAVLGLEDDEDARGEVDVVLVEADHLAYAHARCSQEPDHRLIGGGSQCWCERTSRFHQRLDLVVRVQVGDSPAFRERQQPCRGHLGRRIEGLEVAGEAAYRAEPITEVSRMCTLSWQFGPRKGQLGGDRRRAGGLQVGDEVAQQMVMVRELGAERPADHEVVLRCSAELAHRTPPGQGWASARSATRSTLAYTAVAAPLDCRSACPTSASVAPLCSIADAP